MIKETGEILEHKPMNFDQVKVMNIQKRCKFKTYYSFMDSTKNNKYEYNINKIRSSNNQESQRQ